MNRAVGYVNAACVHVTAWSLLPWGLATAYLTKQALKFVPDRGVDNA